MAAAMNRRRVQMEIRELASVFDIEYDSEEGRMVLKDVQFPDQWTLEQGDVLLDLPSTYPQEPPMVYVPKDLELRDCRSPFNFH